MDSNGTKIQLRGIWASQWVTRAFVIVPRPPRASSLGLDKVKRAPLAQNNHKLNTNPQGLHKGHQGLNSWHQWPYTVGINDKLINNLPLCHWWQHHKSFSEQAPLSTKFLSPFGINGKGTILWPYCSPLDHAPPVINFSSFSTFLPLYIYDNKNLTTSRPSNASNGIHYQHIKDFTHMNHIIHPTRNQETKTSTNITRSTKTSNQRSTMSKEPKINHE